MATSSKRFIILMVLMDLLLMMSWSFSAGGTDFNTQINQFTGGVDNVTSDTNDGFNTINPDQSEQYIKEYGDRISGFTGIGNFFSIKFRLPSSTSCPDCPTGSAGIINGLLWTFFSIIHLLALYEIIMIVVNKKND